MKSRDVVACTHDDLSVGRFCVYNIPRHGLAITPMTVYQLIVNKLQTDSSSYANVYPTGFDNLQSDNQIKLSDTATVTILILIMPIIILLSSKLFYFVPVRVRSFAIDHHVCTSVYLSFCPLVYFYPRGASSARVIAVIVCLSVCLCVCV